MWYNVGIQVTIQGNDNTSLLANPQQGNLGPIVVVKNVTFAGMGQNKEAAIAEAHARARDFLEHEVTVEDGPKMNKIATAAFPTKRPLGGASGAAEDDGN